MNNQTKLKMETETKIKNITRNDGNTMLAVREYRSPGKWQAVKNSSWGEKHKNEA